MIIKKIKLENIRSYINEEIEFPTGSTLLAGNVGAGKSTILLAIDFALFGLTRGILTGSSLLRSGQDSGSVELYFSIDDKEVVVKRSLKSSNITITQDSGFIIINGHKKEASPIELKSTILQLLNYPKDLLTKSKSLIYRYTVYTPQEEMKQILLGEKDLRLETLRRVFNIDKYKRIRENSSILTKAIKEKIREHQGFISDLDIKQNELKKDNLFLQDTKQEELKLNNNLKIKQEELKKQKGKLEQLKTTLEFLEKLNLELQISESNLRNRLEQIKSNQKQLPSLKEQISILESQLKNYIPDSALNEKIKKQDLFIKNLESNLKEATFKIQELSLKHLHSINIKEKITKLDKCPTCLQLVSKQHKAGILENESSILEVIEKESKELEKKKSSLESSIEKESSLLKLFQEQLNLDSINKIKLQNLEEKRYLISSMQEQEDKLKEEVANLNAKVLALSKNLESFRDLKANFEKESSLLEEIQSYYHSLQIELATIKERIKESSSRIYSLEAEIQEKLNSKEKLNSLSSLLNWIDSSFLNIMQLMEKNIMLRLHKDFNSLFQNWFNILINDELLKVSLDEEFTPLITQNNYLIDYLHLSGGEKTALALAYRLSLNQVINNLMSEIKTKDLLILDEPTDGFSSEQLDRIRLVLDELNISQIILVSHEPKIESFVDHVIKLEKKEHVTSLTS